MEVCRRLGVGSEPEVIEAAVPAGASLLELGCGAGRVTGPLVRRGFAVTAVDESAEMLDALRERVTGAETVRSPIESLRLERRFDVVMLASYLVHTAEHRTRQALLETCRRHVRDDGCVLIQREGEVWHRSVRAKDGTGRCRASARILAAARYGSCRPRPPEAAATWQ